MSKQDEVREAFEAWVIAQRFKQWNLEKFGYTGMYKNTTVHAMWLAWQGALSMRFAVERLIEEKERK